MGTIEELILLLVRVGIPGVVFYFLIRYLGWPLFRRYWKPKQIVLDADQRLRVAEARLAATRLEVQAAEAELNASIELDALISRTENGRASADFHRRLETSSPSPNSATTNHQPQTEPRHVKGKQ